jgi:alkylated DNA nucleotide flippase Atl1
MKARKSWREKLATNKDLPKTLVIPAPREVNEIMARVPHGKLTTIDQIRQRLASKHGTDAACPMTTGIFAWIAAHAAAEAAADGEVNTTPYWRTLKSGGQINPKYPGGVKDQVRLLKAEGYKVVHKGQQFFVSDYEKSLFL